MSLFAQLRAPTVLIIAIGGLVGVSFTLSKVAANAGAAPFGALFWQLLVATVILLIVNGVTRRRLKLPPQYLFYYVGAGIFGISAPALIGYIVLGHVSAGLFSAFVTLSPLFTFAISSAVERQMLPMYRLVGILIGLAGVSLVTFAGFDLSDTATYWVFLAALGPLSLAMGNVFRSRAYPIGGDPMVLAAGALLSQLVLILPVMFFVTGDISVMPIATGPQLAIMGVGLITAVTYVLTFEVQKRTDGVGFSQVGYFATLSGIGVGALAFGETLRPELLISLCVLFLGLAISNGQIKPSDWIARLKPRFTN